MEWYYYPILLVAGFVAGYINTIAGSGSLLTLPALMFTGLPATIANGTNRLAILLQGLVASWGFYKKGKLSLPEGVKLSIPSVVGSLIGAFLATGLTDSLMEKIIGFLLVVMGFILFFNPKPENKLNFKHPVFSKLVEWVVFVGIGFYGGFIQAGVGFFLLGGLTLISGKDLLIANALKSLIVTIFTIGALAIFVWHRQVSLLPGLVLSVGSMAGAWVSTQAALRWGVDYIRYVLLFVILAVGIHFIFF